MKAHYAVYFQRRPVEGYDSIERVFDEVRRCLPRRAVYFFSDHSLRGGVDPGFGVPVTWNVPLLDGYQHRFVSKHADITRPLTAKLPSARSFLRGENLDLALISGYTNVFEMQIRLAAKGDHQW